MLSKDGKVYPFGRNNHGQLGLGNLLDCTSPQIIASLRDKFVVKVLHFDSNSEAELTSLQVASGFYHSICLTATKASTESALHTHHTLCHDLGELVNNPMRSDVVFLLSNVRLHAHSCILMARCEPLEKMLDGRMIEGSLSEIRIPDYSVRLQSRRRITSDMNDVQPEVFEVFLEFLYTDEVQSIQMSKPDTGTYDLVPSFV